MGRRFCFPCGRSLQIQVAAQSPGSEYIENYTVRCVQGYTAYQQRVAKLRYGFKIQYSNKSAQAVPGDDSQDF